MKESNMKRAIKNVGFSVLVRVLTFAVGIVIPRLLIVSYGSEINGLLQTVSSIFSYMALLFAGVGTASIQGLYKPLAENNRQGVSAVLVATRRYFRNLVRWFALGVCVFCIAFPFIAKGHLNFFTVFGVIALEGFSHILTYYFTYTVQALLTADGRDYIIQLIQFVVFLITSAVKILLILSGVSVLILQAAYLLINILQIIIYQTYIRSQYSWVNWQAQPNPTPLKKRKNFFINGIAWTVFSSTDTIVISMFCGFAFTSVYAMYNMVFANLNLVLAMFYSSIYFMLGQVYHKDREEYLQLHDGFESVISALTFSLLATAYILILPFLRLYTQNISDINYIDIYLPVLFCLVQILSNARMISGNLINLTNNPQLTNKASIIEVIVNLILSVTLVNVIGLYGVLIGTVIGLLYKTSYIIVVSNRKILNRSPLRTYTTLLTNCGVFTLVVVGSRFVKINFSNYGQFVAVGSLVAIVLLVVFLAGNYLVNPVGMRQCIHKFLKKKA